MSKPKIIIQFNEANFDLISKYLDQYDLPGFKKILNFNTKIITNSEKEYEHLEPWIQWYSFYTGLSFREHNVFHLGDCNKNFHTTFTEEIANNRSVGIFGSMNLKYSDKYDIFIPDAWSDSKTDNSYSSKLIASLIKRIVNTNTKLKISFKDIISLIFLVGIPLKFSDLKILLISFLSLLKKSRVNLASILDYYFLNYSLKRIKKNKINTSMIFLNGFAHIQHHYMLSSKFINGKNPKWYSKDSVDPFLNSLRIYDQLFNQLILKYDVSHDIWIITGLTQKPYENPLIYWRISNPKKIFQNFLNSKFTINQRMSRDFEIVVEEEKDLNDIYRFLTDATIKNVDQSTRAFGHIDKTGKKSLFASFIYKEESKNAILQYGNKSINLNDEIEFVAIKNGEHAEHGWAYSNAIIEKNSSNLLPITNLHKIILNDNLKTY